MRSFNMSVVCPTVLAQNAHQFREQIERILPFASRIQIDLVDGTFAPNQTIDLEQVWLPEDIQCDIHLMYADPTLVLPKLIGLRPHMVILHAESEGNFLELAAQLHAAKILVGVALLPETEPEIIAPAITFVDHVLIFAGKLGQFGGDADFDQLAKVAALREMKASVEIGWDGGVNDKNIQRLAQGGIDVLNVGGFIQRAEAPSESFHRLRELVEEVI